MNQYKNDKYLTFTSTLNIIFLILPVKLWGNALYMKNTLIMNHV